MSVEKRATIKVTAKTDQAAQEFDKLSRSQQKAAASLQKYIDTARKQNAADRMAGFDKATAAADKNGASLGVVAGGLGKLVKSGGAAGAALAGVVAAGWAGHAMATSLADKTMELTGVFQNLPFALDAARTATRGLIDDFELARSANTLVSFGVVKTGQEFADLAGAAQALGQKLGIGTQSAMESLSAALGRNSKLMLDNLGIILNETQAQERYAKSLGKVASRLTEEEKGQAFRIEAMKAIKAAAAGVKVNTDGAAASMQRFNVELANMRDRALGAERPTTSLRDGIAQLTATERKLIGESHIYGASLNQVRDRLRELGVAHDDLTHAFAPYQRLLKEITKSEEDYARSVEGRREVMMNVAGLVKNLNMEFGKAVRGEELKNIERELALLGDNAKARKSVNDLLTKKAEITAYSLQLEGKIDEAEKVRFDEEIRQLRLLSESTNTRRSGIRGLTEAQREFNRELEKARGIQIQRDGSDSREFAAEMDLAKQQQIARGFAEFRRSQVVDAATAEQRKNQSLLEVKLQGFELERAAGVDPWSIAERETSARLAMLDAQRLYIDETLSGQDRLIAHEELAAERRGVLHSLELARIAKEQRAREIQRQRFAVVGNAVGAIHSGIAAAAIRGAFQQGQSAKQAVKHFASAKAQEMTIVGATELIQAGVAATMFNYPLAAQHLANSAAGFGQAAILGATYGALGGGRGGGGGGGGFGGSAFGLGSTGGMGGASGGTGETTQIGKGPPISRQYTTASVPTPPPSSGPLRTRGGPTIQANFYSITGGDRDQQVKELRYLLARSEREEGNA